MRGHYFYCEVITFMMSFFQRDSSLLLVAEETDHVGGVEATESRQCPELFQMFFSQDYFNAGLQKLASRF